MVGREPVLGVPRDGQYEKISKKLTKTREMVFDEQLQKQFVRITELSDIIGYSYFFF